MGLTGVSKVSSWKMSDGTDSDFLKCVLMSVAVAAP